jgi:hypothetical protein
MVFLSLVLPIGNSDYCSGRLKTEGNVEIIVDKMTVEGKVS